MNSPVRRAKSSVRRVKSSVRRVKSSVRRIKSSVRRVKSLVRRVKSPVGHGGKSVKSSLESSVRRGSGSINAMIVSLVAKAYCRV